MTYTVMGRHLYAMGGNEQAAKLSGIRTDRLKWFAYSLGAITSSFVGIVCFAEFGFRQARYSCSRLRIERDCRFGHSA